MNLFIYIFLIFVHLSNSLRCYVCNDCPKVNKASNCELPENFCQAFYVNARGNPYVWRFCVQVPFESFEDIKWTQIRNEECRLWDALNITCMVRYCQADLCNRWTSSEIESLDKIYIEVPLLRGSDDAHKMTTSEFSLVVFCILFVILVNIL